MSKPWNASRFRADDPLGLYESYFQRANHPTRPLAFWIRYTVFSPRAHPEQARGELWAIYFDGEGQRIIAVKQAVPIVDCDFSRTGLNVKSEIDTAIYPPGIKVSDSDMAAINLSPHAFHGEWNYTIAPKPE